MGVTPTTAVRYSVALLSSLSRPRKKARAAPLPSASDSHGPRACTSSVSGLKITKTHHISRYRLLANLWADSLTKALREPTVRLSAPPHAQLRIIHPVCSQRQR